MTSFLKKHPGNAKFKLQQSPLAVNEGAAAGTSI
jgi:hypothetical protein